MNVIIVDDQQDVVESIVRGVNWKRLGVEEIYTANTVVRARELIEEKQIDVGLLDIEMPEETGLDLLSWIRDRDQQMQCVFLTCHAEFAYAQKALSLGCCGYVLQPARFSEIETILEKALALAREQKSAAFAHRTMEESDGRKRAMLQELLENVWQGRQGRKSWLVGELLERFAEVTGSPTEHKDSAQGAMSIVFCPAALWMENAEEKLGNIPEELIRILREEESWEVFGSEPEPGTLLLLFAAPKDAFNERKVEAALHRAEGVLRRRHPAPWVIFQGYPSRLGWQEAIHMLALARKRGCGIGYHRMESPQEEKKGRLQEELQVESWKNWILEGNGEIVLTEIKKYVERRKRQEKPIQVALKQLYYLFNQAFFAALEQSGMDMTGLFDAEHTYDEYALAYTSYEELMKKLERCISIFNKHAGMSEENRIEIACRYIREHISRNLTRGEVAGAVYLNEEYFSKLFKKEMGCGFKDYLVMEKMQYARHLLESTNLSIGLVGSKVGYENFSWFSKAFVKNTGMSPSEYRKKNKKIQNNYK